MKKILTIVALTTAVLFTGCKKTSEFNKYLVEDYELVKAQYPNREVVFYEAEVVLNGTPVELSKKAKPVSVKEVFQVFGNPEAVFVNRNYETGECLVEIHYGYWLGDVVVDPTNITDFNLALNALIDSGIKLPDSPLVTLRNPLGPQPYENPFYIFGSTHTSFVAVDAKTLEVQPFNVVIESGLKEETLTVEE